MKTLKNFLFCLLLISANFAFADNQKFVSAMEKGMSMLNAAKSVDEIQLAANYFERIASAEPKEWLPLYYAAYANLNVGMNGENAKKDEIYDKALSQLASADVISANNSEIYALKAYVILMKLAVNPMARAMKMMPEGMQILEKAKSLNPENPRSFLVQGQFTFYMPEIFGGGKAKAKPLLSIATEKYAVEKPENTIVPKWGKARAEELLNKCN